MLCSLALHSERDLHDAFDGAHVLRTSAFLFREAHATSTLSINIVGGQKASGVSDRSDSDRPETCLLFECASIHRLILHKRMLPTGRRKHMETVFVISEKEFTRACRQRTQLHTISQNHFLPLAHIKLFVTP